MSELRRNDWTVVFIPPKSEIESNFPHFWTQVPAPRFGLLFLFAGKFCYGCRGLD